MPLWLLLLAQLFTGSGAQAQTPAYAQPQAQPQPQPQPQPQAQPQPGAETPSRPRVLVTAFEPFLDLKANGSEKVGRELMREFGGGRSGIDYEFCVLPVVYDEAARAAEACYEKAAVKGKPDLVIATGETNGCYVRLEIRAHNNDQFEAPDNRGEVRRRPRAIVPGGAAQEYFTFPGEAMYCALVTAPTKVNSRLSTSPGNFLCNHAAYHLNRRMRDKGVPFGFVHLPEAACPARKIQSAAAALHRMVQAALGQAPAEGEWPDDGHICHGSYRKVVDQASETQGLPQPKRRR